MNSRQLEHLRETKATARELREALDDLPPLAWTALARASTREGHSLEELYKWLDRLDVRLDKKLVKAARKKAR